MTSRYSRSGSSGTIRPERGKRASRRDARLICPATRTAAPGSKDRMYSAMRPRSSSAWGDQITGTARLLIDSEQAVDRGLGFFLGVEATRFDLGFSPGDPFQQGQPALLETVGFSVNQYDRRFVSLSDHERLPGGADPLDKPVRLLGQF